MSEARHSYDLFERGPGWVAEVALVISPYVERSFFARIARDLNPERLHVVIDDGCRREDMETVRRAVAGCGTRRPPELVCRLGSAPGLVHAKLFYVSWRTPSNRVARTLVFGSANATRQGFSGTVNAELVASCRLVASRHRPAIAWCEDVVAATLGRGTTEVPGRRDVSVGVGVRLRFPHIRVGRERSALSNLDLWIQRGYLLSEYRPDPSFLKVPIELGVGIAPAEQARVAASFGFAVPQTRRLSYAYVPASGPDPDDGPARADEAGSGNWRRRLFVWTQLGDWCSEACFEAHRTRFRRRGSAERRRRLRRLERLRADHARDAFLAALSGLWEAFGSEAPTLLRGSGGVDRAFYADCFDQRVARDLELAADDEFRERYLRGYELAQVPRFRSDDAGWRRFVSSLARQLCLDATRGHSQSKLFQAVREAVEAAGLPAATFDDPDALLGALRRIWGVDRPTAGATRPALVIAGYHARE